MMHTANAHTYASRMLHRVLKVAAIVIALYAILLVMALLTGALADGEVPAKSRIAAAFSAQGQVPEAAAPIMDDVLSG